MSVEALYKPWLEKHTPTISYFRSAQVRENVCYFVHVGSTLEGISDHEGVNETQCVCPGDKLTYECTIQGETTGATIWKGNALSGCQQNAILLQHHQFTPTGGSAGTCNNGAIVGQSLGIQGNNYTSQLNVTITPETAGKTITCAYDALTAQDIMVKFSTIIPGTNHLSCTTTHYRLATD
jgi:hypothetical protein